MFHVKHFRENFAHSSTERHHLDDSPRRRAKAKLPMWVIHRKTDICSPNLWAETKTTLERRSATLRHGEQVGDGRPAARDFIIKEDGRLEVHTATVLDHRSLGRTRIEDHPATRL